jgi:hypothetical protein
MEKVVKVNSRMLIVLLLFRVIAAAAFSERSPWNILFVLPRIKAMTSSEKPM